MRDPSSKPTATGARWSPSPDHSTAAARSPGAHFHAHLLQMRDPGIDEALIDEAVRDVGHRTQLIGGSVADEDHTDEEIDHDRRAGVAFGGEDDVCDRQHKVCEGAAASIELEIFVNAPRRDALPVRLSPHDVQPHDGGPCEDVAPGDAEKPHGATKIDRSPPGWVGET